MPNSSYIIPARIKHAAKTSTQWQLDNDILELGEFGVESDTTLFKVGDGVATWNLLRYYQDVSSLPIWGGTLTGELRGTSAVFSGDVTGNNVISENLVQGTSGSFTNTLQSPNANITNLTAGNAIINNVTISKADLGIIRNGTDIVPDIIENEDGTQTLADNGGFIDFHWQGNMGTEDAPVDYTTRIIEDVSGKLKIIGALNIVGGDGINTTKLVASGNTTTNTLTVSGASSLASLTVSGNTVLNTVTVGGATIMNGALSVTHADGISTTKLTVSGATALNTVTISGATNIAGPLGVTHADGITTTKLVSSGPINCTNIVGAGSASITGTVSALEFACGNSIEITPPITAGHGGCIDFHYNGSTEDYTSRIIADGANELSLIATGGVFVNSTIYPRLSQSFSLGGPGNKFSEGYIDHIIGYADGATSPVYIPIPSSADLNNYQNKGYYLCALDATAATVTNSPTEGKAFSMEVIDTGTASGTIACKMQIVYRYDTGAIFKRIFWGGIWYAWRTLATTNDIPTVPDFPLAGPGVFNGGISDTEQDIMGAKNFTTGITTKLFYEACQSSEIDVFDSLTLDFGSYHVQRINVTGNTTILVNPIIPGGAYTIAPSVIIRNGGGKITWQNVLWAGGTPPELTATGIDIVTFLCVPGTGNNYGIVATDFK